MDISAYMAEVETVRPRLLAIARKILEDDEEAEDVVQDALLRLWQLREEPIDHAERLAQTVVRNLSIDLVRRRRRTASLSHISTIDTPSDETEEQMERMMTMVEALPTMQQTVLRLRHIEGMEMRDIAELVGTTEQAVRQSLSRARRTLKERYTQQQRK